MQRRNFLATAAAVIGLASLPVMASPKRRELIRVTTHRTASGRGYVTFYYDRESVSKIQDLIVMYQDEQWSGWRRNRTAERLVRDFQSRAARLESMSFDISKSRFNDGTGRQVSNEECLENAVMRFTKKYPQVDVFVCAGLDVTR